MVLNANALTSLAFAKTYLKIPALETSLDSLVEFWINVASQRIETEVNRKLKSQSYTHYFDGRNNNIILLQEFPVTAISSVAIDSTGSFTDPGTVVDSSGYKITDNQNSVVLLNEIFPRGFFNVKIVYTAGFAAVPCDLENACLWIVSYYHKMRDTGDIGRTAKGKGDESVTILQDMPKDVRDTLAFYKRPEIVTTSRSIYNV